MRQAQIYGGILAHLTTFGKAAPEGISRAGIFTCGARVLPWTGRPALNPSLNVSYLSPEPNDVRLVGGASRCAGKVELLHQGEWRRLVRYSSYGWTLKTAAIVCRELDCGSAVSTRWVTDGEKRPVWWFKSNCTGSESTLRECGSVDGNRNSYTVQELICSGNILSIPSS